MNLEKLDEPFAIEDIEWRVQQCGMASNGPWAMVLCYVTNRAIMKRLDEVCGKTGWRNEFQPSPSGGVLCGISIKHEDEWITKWDGAENTQVEAVKGGISGAMKRAAVQWGIGRYLYLLEERFAVCSTERNNQWNKAAYKDKSNKYVNIWWQTPDLPAWALPPTPPIPTLDEIILAFSESATKATTEEQLTNLYKSAWAAVGDSKPHQDKVVDIFKHRKSDFKKAA
ncbi:DNA damage response protein A [Serratia quinivorans]|uniref:Rad52/Rad22 family DNA repair protein n=1 Tax=Serratia quinivorans TaxID=137545 RepID=UPI0021776FAF|nr:Rad52/Rad22 family DNA repair protein [Serratia quinivorans]CAI1818408.1 DNA damage response protein A [Serratia quinivorans]